MAFKKGDKKLTGRVKGTPNKITASVKEVFTTVFTDLQNDKEAKLSEWAKQNTTEFYKLCAKLIPVAINADLTTNGKEIKQVFKIGNTEIEL